MTDYAKLKVTDLKELIKERGIASTGLKVKQNYVDALEADDDEKSGGGDNDVTGKSEEMEDVAAAAEQTDAVKADGDVEDVKEENKGDMEDVKMDSPAAGERAVEEPESGNKRKRRSPTPPLSEEVVAKKLKTAEVKGETQDVDVKLPEDVADTQDALDITPAGPPSVHAPTCSLYIRGLVRPLQPNTLRTHLISIAQSSEPATIDEFHLDRLRTHAFVRFNSISAASQVRAALHDTVWPDEPMRKTLWIDFVPDDKLEEWVNTEVNRGDMTRWEVVYEDEDEGVVARLQEVDSGGGGGGRKQSTQAQSSRNHASAGEGMPNAPSGPRRRSTQLQAPPTPADVEPPKPVHRGFASLDELFNSTDTKPKIYYKPVSAELAEARQEEMDRNTHVHWNDADADPSAYGEGELRRYTFEDGVRLVDGGADFGLFGRRGRGGGGGGGGGYRGGRGGRAGGDHYRGGGNRWR